jgi:hypothetical protein
VDLLLQEEVAVVEEQQPLPELLELVGQVVVEMEQKIIQLEVLEQLTLEVVVAVVAETVEQVEELEVVLEALV